MPLVAALESGAVNGLLKRVTGENQKITGTPVSSWASCTPRATSLAT